jgi:ACS family hexuronate transporter-like MFS transporter
LASELEASGAGDAPRNPPRSDELPAVQVGKYRWTICALLFFATTINYMDRQVLGILAPTLQRDIGWTEVQYGNVVSYFTVAYAIGFLFAGRLMDRFGSRIGYSVSAGVWSLAAMGPAVVSSVTGFGVVRFILGLAESGNFPAALKTVAEWFPARERAFAIGVFNGGSNIGAVLTPIVVPWITIHYGWRAAFLVVGGLGFVWLAFWLALYRRPTEHSKVSAAELAYIQSDPTEATTPVPWSQLLRYRQTWAYGLGKLLTDPIWWFYLYWLPKFLDARFHVQLAEVAAPLIVVYLLADVGSVGGGWLSGYFIRRGWSVNMGRKITLLIAALLIVPTIFATRMSGMWPAVLIIGVACSAHQWWSCNLMTLPSDMFPRRAVGSVVGIGGFLGAMGGFLFQRMTGMLLQANGDDYRIIFFMCGSAYLLALLVIHLLVPRLERAPVM